MFYRTLYILNHLLQNKVKNFNIMSKQTSNACPQTGVKSKLKKNSALKEFQQCKSHVYACFEQPQTINIIPYLTMPTPNKLCFDSNKKKEYQNPAQSDAKDRFDKKQKQFKFSKIYQRQEKFKYAFSQEINLIVSKLFKGLSQTVFIYGTQQTKKDKILIGQSQNSGLLLTTLSQIFQYCHEKQIQDQVTIKLSCMMYKNGAFTDVFGVLDTEQLKKQCSFPQQKQRQKSPNNDQQDYKRQKEPYNKLHSNSIFCDDKLQKKYFLGVPQIIIRNMRTALKIVNLICKKMQQRRDQHQENTQNLIYTIKMELDTGYDRYTGQVFEYNIPKLHIIKLANPSVDNTLNGISKNNEWFINLFNFLQNQVRLQKNLKKLISENNVQIIGSQQQRLQLQKLFITSQKEKSQQLRVSSSEKQDQFTTFIKDVALDGVSDIHCFTSITNKMTSNQCLTAFIFNNYILGYKTRPLKTVLNFHLLKEEKSQIQQQLLNLFQAKQSQVKKQKQILKKQTSFSVSKSCQKKQISSKTADNSILKSKTHFNAKSKAQKTSTKRNNYKQLAIKNITEEEFQEQFDQNKLLLLKYIENINKFTQSCNIVEYQYSLVFGAACQKLNKYIFNEQIQEFYYAKKVSTQISSSLKQSVWSLMQRKKYMSVIKQKMMKKINTQIGKLQSEIQYSKNSGMKLQTEEILKFKKQQMLHLSKQKQIYLKLFEIYDTMAYHYLYQNNKILMTNLQQTKLKVEQQIKLKNDQIQNINYEQILNNIKKGFKKRIQQKKLPSLTEEENELQDQLNQILPQELKQNEISNPLNNQNKKQAYSNKDQAILNHTCYKPAKISPSKALPLNKTILNQNSQKNGESIWGCKKRRNFDQLQNMFTNSNVGRMSKTLYR